MKRMWSTVVLGIVCFCFMLYLADIESPAQAIAVLTGLPWLVKVLIACCTCATVTIILFLWSIEYGSVPVWKEDPAQKAFELLRAQAPITHRAQEQCDVSNGRRVARRTPFYTVTHNKDHCPRLVENGDVTRCAGCRDELRQRQIQRGVNVGFTVFILVAIIELILLT